MERDWVDEADILQSLEELNMKVLQGSRAFEYVLKQKDPDVMK